MFRKRIHLDFNENVCKLIASAAKAKGITKNEMFLRNELNRLFKELPEQIPCAQKSNKKRITIPVDDEELWNFCEQLACKFSTNISTIVTALVIFPTLIPHLFSENKKAPSEDEA